MSHNVPNSMEVTEVWATITKSVLLRQSQGGNSIKTVSWVTKWQESMNSKTYPNFRNIQGAQIVYVLAEIQ